MEVWLDRFRATHHLTENGALRWCTFDGRPMAEQAQVTVDIDAVLTAEFGNFLRSQRDG